MEQPKLDVEARKRALLRETLDRVGDRWTMLVLDALDNRGRMRFTELRNHLEHVSQKMLTKTLRALERDGLLLRTVHPVVPPRVEYELTPQGSALAAAVCVLWEWVEAHDEGVAASRAAYDEKLEGAPPDDDA